VDRLQRDVTSLVGTRPPSDRRVVFEEIRARAYQHAGLPRPAAIPSSPARAVPYLDEAWYCCAEPNPEEMRLV
jgi:hypothetical protein